VSLTLSNRDVTLTLEDDGAPFDPLSLAAPDVTASLEGRRVGGLGVFLVRQVMDTVSYQRRGTMNQLRMTKSLIGIGKSHV
jgi:serine/threonine-protein kinase RsbW